MIKVLIVDDHTLVRAGLSRLLDMENDIEVVGQASSGHEAIRFCRDQKPDLVLLDYSLPDLDGLETTRQILSIDHGIRILILTMYANEEYATRLIRAGASGFLVKAASTDELKTAVRKGWELRTLIIMESDNAIGAQHGPPAPELPTEDVPLVRGVDDQHRQVVQSFRHVVRRAGQDAREVAQPGQVAACSLFIAAAEGGHGPVVDGHDPSTADRVAGRSNPSTEPGSTDCGRFQRVEPKSSDASE